MNTLIMYWAIVSLMTVVMLMLPMFLSKLTKKWFNKNSSFECGMSLSSTPRKPFSIQFFLLMMLFIIFDIEIVLIVAIPMLTLLSQQMMLFFMMFLSVLMSGVMYEWIEGSLNWKM